MTQEELGVVLGVKKSAVQKIESGQNANIRADKIMLLCEKFKVYPYSLLCDNFCDFWEKVFHRKLEVHDKMTDDTDMSSTLLTLLERFYGVRSKQLINHISLLNDTGMERAIAYIDDLSKIKEYQKGEPLLWSAPREPDARTEQLGS